MNPVITREPVVYDPSMEQAEPDEQQTAADIVETMRGISETVFKDSGHAERSVHAKSHGILSGELHVLEGLPDRLAQGLFARPGRYQTIIRLSTNPGDILDDSVSTPRGMALKVIGVEGEHVSGQEKEVTQDFVLVNGPAFSASTAKAFLKSLKLLAATTDQPQVLKKILSAALRGAESVLETFGGESGTLKSLGGHPETHILGETFYSQVPILYGRHIAKVQVAPVSPELTALTDAPLDVNDAPNGLRDAVIEFFEHNAAEWELRVQLCTDLETMPIEDATKVWPEEESPFVPVARLVVGPQPGWSELRSRMVDDDLAFSPWHALAAHRPLGSVMRVRKPAYEMSARFRAEHNGTTTAEPRCPIELPH